MECKGFKMKFIATSLMMVAAVVRSKKMTEFRLPMNLKPVSYRLNVTTHLEDKFMFKGVVDIKITCTKATDTIVLHSNKLQIDTTAVVIVDGSGNVVQVNSVSFVPEKELMYVKSSQNLKSGDNYVLTIPFIGKFTDNLKGYYKGSYVDKETNQTRWFAVTQFEPTDARRAFPCFDEPNMKATFKITLGHQKNLTTVSNMRLIKTTLMPSNPDFVLDEFEDSMPMSTYLVAYMVSDFAYIESNDENNDVKFRIIARKDAINQTKLAKNLGPLLLKYYENYIDEKFPLIKLDMAAIPDLNARGMENWGLITYRETAVLLDRDVATFENVYQVANIIAHEMSHQWFGNLVTMRWWTDIWLNEGFATYVAACGVDFLYPEWNSLQFQNIQNFIQALDHDSLQSSHPVSVPIGHPDEIARIFDTISYKKGSFLLHMMNMFLTKETFKLGIRNYIDNYKFSNADQDDLWSSLTVEAHRTGSLAQNISVKEIMDTWTLQTGYPVLKVIRDYSTGIVTLSQKKFSMIKPNNTDNKSCWWIPLTMTTSTKMNFNQSKASTWLKCNNTHTMTLTKDNEWVIFNVQIAGLYRVLYDKRNWMAIISTLNDPNEYNKIHTLNRVQLIEDSFKFSQIGDLDYDVTFQLLNYLRHEKEYIPWWVALRNLDYINTLLKRTSNHGVFQNYMKQILFTAYKQFQNISTKLERIEDIRFKNLVVTHACNQKIKHCIEQAMVFFNMWMTSDDPDNNDNILPRELKPIIYCQALKFGGINNWNFVWERYQRSNVETEKQNYLLALSCSLDTWLLNRYLNWTIKGNSIIRKQDAVTVFHLVSNSNIGFNVAKEFLYHRIKDISEFFQRDPNRLDEYLSIIGSHILTAEELNEIQSFINIYSTYFKGADLIINQIIESVKMNTEWTSKFYHKIVNYMV